MGRARRILSPGRTRSRSLLSFCSKAAELRCLYFPCAPTCQLCTTGPCGSWGDALHFSPLLDTWLHTGAEIFWWCQHSMQPASFVLALHSHTLILYPLFTSQNRVRVPVHLGQAVSGVYKNKQQLIGTTICLSLADLSSQTHALKLNSSNYEADDIQAKKQMIYRQIFRQMWGKICWSRHWVCVNGQWQLTNLSIGNGWIKTLLPSLPSQSCLCLINNHLIRCTFIMCIIVFCVNQYLVTSIIFYH